MPKIVDHDQRREEYLAALWRVVDRDGATAISVRSVAAEAGTSKSSIGHYFASQADLVSAAVAQQVSQVSEQLDRLDLTAFDEDRAVEAAMIAIPTTARRRRESQVWLLLLSQQGSDAELRRVLAALDGEVLARLRQFMQVLDGNGLLGAGRVPDDEAARLHALVDGLSLRAAGDTTGRGTRRIRELVRLHVRELAQPLS